MDPAIVKIQFFPVKAKSLRWTCAAEFTLDWTVSKVWGFQEGVRIWIYNLKKPDPDLDQNLKSGQIQIGLKLSKVKLNLLNPNRSQDVFRGLDLDPGFLDGRIRINSTRHHNSVAKTIPLFSNFELKSTDSYFPIFAVVLQKKPFM